MTSSWPYSGEDLRPTAKSSTVAATAVVELWRLGFNKGQMLKGKDRLRNNKKKEDP
jgi:hypothetical protein